MTQISKPLSEFDNGEEIDLRQLFFSIWRGKWWVLVSLIICLVLGGLYVITAPKIYTARAVFGFQKDNKQVLPQELSMLFGASALLEKNEETLTQITGGNFLREIVIKLNLLEKPEFKDLVNTPEISPYSIQYFKKDIRAFWNCVFCPT